VTCNANITLKTCTLECGICEPGKRHVCRKCGSENHHRTDECPYKEVHSCTKCSGGSIFALPIRSSGVVLATGGSGHAIAVASGPVIAVSSGHVIAVPALAYGSKYVILGKKF
jgi:hypothetical protein